MSPWVFRHAPSRSISWSRLSPGVWERGAGAAACGLGGWWRASRSRYRGVHALVEVEVGGGLFHGFGDKRSTTARILLSFISPGLLMSTPELGDRNGRDSVVPSSWAPAVFLGVDQGLESLIPALSRSLGSALTPISWLGKIQEILV